MATQRLESGQVNLRGAGAVPMQQVGVPQVDFVAQRVQASGNAQLAQALDRMAMQVTNDALHVRQQEGFQWAAENPLTDEQFQAASKGLPLDVNTNPLSAFGAAVRKARSLELAGHFETEGMGQLVKIQADVEAGTMTANQAAQKIKQMSDGMAKALARTDGDAAYKFRASMATHGNTVLQHAYRTELQRTKQERLIKFDMAYDNATRLLETAAQESPDLFDKYAGTFRENILGQAMLMGDASVQKEYSNKLEPAIKTAQVNAVVKSLMNDAALSDNRGTINKLRTGDVGIYSNMVKKLMTTDFATYQRIEDEFTKMVRARKEGIDLALTDSKKQGDEIMRSMYSTTNPKLQRQLFDELKNLPVDPSVIKTAREFIYSDEATGPQRDDLAAFGKISQRVALGLASPEEIQRAPLTRNTKKELLRQWANPNDDVSFGTNQINLAVGIQSSNLPPELKDAKARQEAVQTRNTLVMELTNYARTADEKGMLPTPADVRTKGIELSKRAKSSMGKAWNSSATEHQKSAVSSIKELEGVDLNDEAAVATAIANAVKDRKVNPVLLRSARDSIQQYRESQQKFKDSQE